MRLLIHNINPTEAAHDNIHPKNQVFRNLAYNQNKDHNL